MLGRWDTMGGWGGDGGLWMLAGILVIAVAVLIGVWLIVRTSRDNRGDVLSGELEPGVPNSWRHPCGAACHSALIRPAS
jgi:hypothetical protein